MTAYTTQVSTIYCDHGLTPTLGGCNKSVEVEGTRAAVRAEAKRDGWAIGKAGSPDFCPDHRTRGRR